jgi:hypothetical protein
MTNTDLEVGTEDATGVSENKKKNRVKTAIKLGDG